MEAALLEALLARLGELGLVGAGMPQRTDSTHVLGRVRDLNRLELAGESVRAALEALAAAAPAWLAGVIDASWQRVYGQRIDDFRLPAPGWSRRMTPTRGTPKNAARAGPGTRCTCPRPAMSRTRPGGGRPRT